MVVPKWRCYLNIYTWLIKTTCCLEINDVNNENSNIIYRLLCKTYTAALKTTEALVADARKTVISLVQTEMVAREILEYSSSTK